MNPTQKAFEYNPDNYQVWYLLGLANFYVQQPAEAINFLLPYTGINPQFQGYYYLGLSYFNNEQYNEAVRYLESVSGKLRNRTMNLTALSFTGQAYLKLKNYSRALEIFEEGLKQSPGDRSFLSAHG